MTGRLGAGLGMTGAVVLLALVSLVWTPDLPTRMHLAAEAEAAALGRPSRHRPFRPRRPVDADGGSLELARHRRALGGARRPLGTLCGVAAAIRRGVAEAVIMRTCDVVFAVPPILSAMMLGSLLGPGRTTADRGDRGLHRPGLRPRHAGCGPAGLVARLHPGGAGGRQGRGPHRLGTRPAQYRKPDRHPDDAPAGPRDPDRGGPRAISGSAHRRRRRVGAACWPMPRPIWPRRPGW